MRDKRVPWPPPWHPCLCRDHLGHHVARVHVDGADGHDLHPVASAEAPDEQRDERVQLADLRERRPLRWTLGGARPSPGRSRELTASQPRGKTILLLFSVMERGNRFPRDPTSGRDSPGAPENDSVGDNLVLGNVVEIK